LPACQILHGGGREILCVGSVGSIPSASSGMNTDGLCMADTAVRTRDFGIGALRYYLMEALLIRCARAEEAITLIRSLPHVGGGTLVLGDGNGAIAALELSHAGAHVSGPGDAGCVARTNHYTVPDFARRMVQQPGSALRANSESRLAGLRARLGEGVASWDVAECGALLAEHAEARGHAAICRHGEHVATRSGSIFDPASRRLRLPCGNPCAGDWRVAVLA
jgi:hypothetical protein